MASYDSGISDSDKVKIVSDFLLKAPPGEFNEVFNDVRVLLNNDQLLKEGAAGAFAQYNKVRHAVVEVPGQSHKTLITKYGEVEPGVFLDPRGSVKFSFDHLRKEASNVTPVSPDGSAEPYRKALDDAILTYVENHYPAGVSAIYGSSNGGQVNITVALEDHKYNPNNYWNGGWTSEWHIQFAPGAGSAELKGLFKVNVHYYEDGNVQLLSNKDVSVSVSVGSPDAFAKSVVSAIEKAENEYQQGISENYAIMSDTTFKALRRALPITRGRLDWNKILSYKVAAELNK
eukprot:Colp12_sorted_trinity150504_noHs@13310